MVSYRIDDLQPNHVFVIPEKRDLHIFGDEFRLRPISKPRGWSDVITVFLRSLTTHWDGKLIAIIVSGYDSDGANALCGIKEVGGISIAQKPDSAEQPDMPESAIAKKTRSAFPCIFLQFPGKITFTSLNMNGLSLILRVLPLAMVTFLRMTSLVLT